MAPHTTAPSDAPVPVDARRPARTLSKVSDEHGWVMVPVMAMLVIALGLAFAALALVDQQTSAAGEERQADASQVLAEGALNATASVLASDEGRAEWNRQATTACTTIRGNLATATSSTSTFVRAVDAEVRKSFDAGKDAAGKPQSSYVARGTTSTRWRVAVCPTSATPATDTQPWAASTGTDPDLARTGPTGSADGQKQLWVRAQADVPSIRDEARRSRAVVAKVQEDGTAFTPPTEYGVGAGGFTTDVGAGLNGLLKPLTHDSPLLGSVLGNLLGTSSSEIIARDTEVTPSQQALIGLRCGVLNSLDDVWSADLTKVLEGNLCLGGVLGGVDGLASNAGLKPLTDVLGVNPPFRNLNGLRMAPTAAVEAYRAAAQTATGVYRDASHAPAGGGDVKALSRTISDTVPSCLTTSEWATLNAQTAPSQSVVFLEQVGNGEQYCAIDQPSRAKIFVVNKGGVVVRQGFDGVVYALNGNETISQSNPTSLQKPRELVRIEGAQGKVTGSVWVDGARGQVGVYPTNADAAVDSYNNALQQQLSSVTKPADTLLCSIADSTGLLGAVVGPVLNVVGDLLHFVLKIGTNTQRWVLPVGSATPTGAPPAADGVSGQGCQILKAALGAAGGPTQVYKGTNVQGSVQTETWARSQTCLTGLICGGWSSWAKQANSTSTTSATFTSGLLDQVLGLGTLTTNLLSGLSSAFQNHPPAIQHRISVIRNARVTLPDNAALVPNTFKNVAPTSVPN